ncbi:helix-turn-helix transcriptional regulator [Citrobacter braakii]|nr:MULTISPECIES: AlpA family phage regulatory protein [Enterobacteriaceae]MCG0075279.1 AlpA family phage regulatory protein [Escherichia coli]WIF78677.1 AlpA family phage regulatory protein [Citrobacter braakii]
MCELFNRKRNRIYVMEKMGLLPKAVKLNGRTIGWEEKDIEEFIKQQKN